MESTLSLLSVTHEQSLNTDTLDSALEPVYFLALLDIKASWFKKWMVKLMYKRCFLKMHSELSNVELM